MLKLGWEGFPKAPGFLSGRRGSAKSPVSSQSTVHIEEWGLWCGALGRSHTGRMGCGDADRFAGQSTAKPVIPRSAKPPLRQAEASPQRLWAYQKV